jgi:hypothetical protein
MSIGAQTDDGGREMSAVTWLRRRLGDLYIGFTGLRFRKLLAWVREFCAIRANDRRREAHE